MNVRSAPIRITAFLLLILALCVTPAYEANGAEAGDVSAFSNGSLDGASPDNPSTSLPEIIKTPTNDDVTYQMLRQLIGPGLDKIRDRFFGGGGPGGGGPNIESNELSLTSSLLKFIAAIAVIFGGILMTYISIVGTLNSAQSGTFLGKWDSTFLPLRVIVGFGAALPAPMFGGLALVQAIIVVFGLMGIGAASSFWSYASGLMIDQPVLTPPQSPSNLSKTAEAAFVSFVCDEVLSAAYGDGYSPGGLHQINPRFGTVFIVGPKNRRTGGGKCGKFTARNDIILAKNTSALPAVLSQEKTLKSGLITGATASFVTMAGRMKALAHDVYASARATGGVDVESYGDRYAAIYDAYQSEVLNTTLSLYKTDNATENGKLKALMDKHGWALAGSFFAVLSLKQDAISNAYQAAAAVVSSSATLPDVSSFRSVAADLVRSFSVSKQVIRQAASVSETLKLTRNVLVNDGNEESSIFQKIMDPLYSLISGNIPFIGGSSGGVGLKNPMARIRSTGNIIVNTTFTVFFVSQAVNNASGILGKAVNAFPGAKLLTNTGGVIEKAGVIGTMIVLSLFSVGILMAFVVPLLPFAMWFIAIIGYLIYFVEALLASPFWAVLHAHPKGDDVIGGGGAGYPILFTLILKPTFMVAGLVFAIVLFRVSVWFLDESIQMSFELTRTGSFNAVSLLVYLVFYSTLLVILAYRLFSLPSDLPDAMLRWMGVQDNSDLGDRETKDRTVAVFAAAAGQSTALHGKASQALGGGSGGGGGESGKKGAKRETDRLSSGKQSPALYSDSD